MFGTAHTKDHMLYFLNMYRRLHGVHIKLNDFWPQFNEFIDRCKFDMQEFRQSMTIDEAIEYASSKYNYGG